MKKRQRIEYLLAGILMLSLFIGSLFLTNYFFKKELLSQQQTYLEKKANLLSEQLPKELFTSHSLTDEQKSLIAQYTTGENERLTLMDREANIFYDTSDPSIHDSRKNRPEVKAVLGGASHGSALRVSDTLNTELLYLTIPVYKNNELQGLIRISEETSQFSDSIQSFRRYIFFALGILFLVITSFVFLLLHQKNEPLVTVLPVLKKIVKYPDETRSIIQHSPEWNELYETVNLLSQQMSQTYLAYTSTDKQFHALLEELMIGVFIIDINGSIRLINPKMSEILGLKQEAIDKNYVDIIQEPVLIHLIQRTATEKKTLHQEINLTACQNDTILDVSLRYMKESSNQYQVLGIAYDLTRVRQLEKMQKDFVSNVSHELKTPVTSLLGFTETLLDGAKDDPETLEQFLKIMQKDAERLQQLIYEILQLARDEKNLSYNTQEIQLYRFTSELLKSYHSLIAEKELSITILGTMDTTYTTKYELFYPIVKNLIENAIHYTPDRGKISINFTTTNGLRYCVKDNGLGISLDDQERIFERFYRVDKARSRHSGGTGLGLAIVQNYTELLGGTVTIDSHLGLGSTFIITIPAN